MGSDIFYHKFESDDTDISLIYHLLSPTRREKIDKIKSEKGKRNAAFCEILLYQAIFGAFPAKQIDFQYEYGKNEKPYLKNYEMFFSFSHSKDMVACAISDSEVGCDIEHIGEPKLNLAKRFFHEKEYSYLSEISDDTLLANEFYRIWTMKESYIKYTGEGMSAGLSSFCVLNKAFDKMITSKRVGDYYISVCADKSPIEKYPPKMLLFYK